MNSNIEASWHQKLMPEFEKPYFKALDKFISNEYDTCEVYPPKRDIFSAFDQTPFNNVKVVILGQDPYHEPGQAHGLCFSVPDNVTIPRSLLNIYKEIELDLQLPRPKSGNLTRWAQQGVFLLNATLTVRAKNAGSHQKKGWESFTDQVIQQLSDEKENLVFILWGAYAQKKGSIINESKHLVLKSVHPSPLSASRGFFGNHHFSLTNKYLEAHGIDSIDW